MNEKPPLYTVDVRLALERLRKPRLVPPPGSGLAITFTDTGAVPKFSKKGLWRSASMSAILVSPKKPDETSGN